MNNPVFFADYSGESVALPTALLYGASLLLLSIFAYTTADPNVQSGMQNSINSFVDKVEKTATKAVQWLVSALSEGEALTSIAQQYGTYQCKQAAEAMKKANNNGKIVELYFPGAYNGYVVSDRYSYAISENGYHYGYLHNGIVRCNVYPEGLPLDIWIQRFDATGPAPQIRLY